MKATGANLPVVSRLDAAHYFETLVTRMEGAIAIDALLLGMAEEGAWLAAQLVNRLPGQHAHAYLCPAGLAEGVLSISPEIQTVGEAPIVLVDTVLWHGEWVARAAQLLRARGITVLIELAVLVDRGGRTVPVAPTYSGGEVMVAMDTTLRLKREGSVLCFEEAPLPSPR